MLRDLQIRPTVRAVIRNGPLVLVQVKQSETGARYFTLPGGRQEWGETMQDCLARECLEEVGASPEIGDLLHVADVFRTSGDKRRHLSEVLFHATLPRDYAPRMGTNPDKRQIGTVWADPVQDGVAFLPRYDRHLVREDAPLYLGRLICETP